MLDLTQLQPTYCEVRVSSKIQIKSIFSWRSALHREHLLWWSASVDSRRLLLILVVGPRRPSCRVMIDVPKLALCPAVTIISLVSLVETPVISQ